MATDLTSSFAGLGALFGAGDRAQDQTFDPYGGMLKVQAAIAGDMALKQRQKIMADRAAMQAGEQSGGGIPYLELVQQGRMLARNGDQESARKAFQDADGMLQMIHKTDPIMAAQLQSAAQGVDVQANSPDLRERVVGADGRALMVPKIAGIGGLDTGVREAQELEKAALYVSQKAARGEPISPDELATYNLYAAKQQKQTAVAANGSVVPSNATPPLAGVAGGAGGGTPGVVGGGGRGGGTPGAANGAPGFIITDPSGARRQNPATAGFYLEPEMKAKLQQEAGPIAATGATYKAMTDSFKPEYFTAQGWLQAKSTGAAAYLGLPISASHKDFLTGYTENVAQTMLRANEELKLRSGTAVTANEWDRMKLELPTPDDNPVSFQAKLVNARLTHMAVDLKSRIMLANGIGPTNPMLDAVSLRSDLKAEFNRYRAAAMKEGKMSEQAANQYAFDRIQNALTPALMEKIKSRLAGGKR